MNPRSPEPNHPVAGRPVAGRPVTGRPAAGAPDPAATGGGAPSPAGLDPAALFGNVSQLDERQSLQWLGHLQRLASTGLLAGGMTHDMAGLLQPMLGECERVLLRDDPSEYRAALVKVREWARRSAEYTRALLDLVKRDEAPQVAVPVEKVVEETLVLLESARKGSGVSIRRRLDNFHHALVDRARLMQAVLNLATNAVRAAAQGGREVEVSVRGWQRWVVVEVRDDGPGVPEAIRGRIFQPFVHGDSGPAPGSAGSGAGTGLGLYITKRLIEDQGGRIEWETATGSGTTFRLFVEAAPMEKRQPHAGPAQVEREPRGGT